MPKGYTNLESTILRKDNISMRKTILIMAAALSIALTACANGSMTDSGSQSPNSTGASNASNASMAGSSSGGVLGATAENSSQAQSDYTYKNEDGGIEITGSTVTAENVVIPGEINGKRVVSISGNAKTPLFPNAKKVTLPDTLEELDEYAFANCTALTEITIPASVEEIDDCAFMNCTALSSITFSKGLKDIGEGAFKGCTSLTKIDLPDTLLEIDYSAFDPNVEFTVTYRGSSYTPANINDLYRLLS